jgi:hypothetical protein
VVSSKVNRSTGSRSESKSEKGVELLVLDPKRCDLSMGRLKRG